MKQKQSKLTKKTLFVFKRAMSSDRNTIDPTTTSVIIIATETLRTTP